MSRARYERMIYERQQRSLKDQLSPTSLNEPIASVSSTEAISILSVKSRASELENGLTETFVPNIPGKEAPRSSAVQALAIHTVAIETARLNGSVNQEDLVASVMGKVEDLSKSVLSVNDTNKKALQAELEAFKLAIDDNYKISPAERAALQAFVDTAAQKINSDTGAETPKPVWKRLGTLVFKGII